VRCECSRGGALVISLVFRRFGVNVSDRGRILECYRARSGGSGIHAKGVELTLSPGEGRKHGHKR